MRRTAMIWCALLAVSILIVSGCGEDAEEVEMDTTPPTVEDVIAAGGISAAATNGPILVVFGEAVDPATVQTAVTLNPSVSGAVS